MILILYHTERSESIYFSIRRQYQHTEPQSIAGIVCRGKWENMVFFYEQIMNISIDCRKKWHLRREILLLGDTPIHRR